MLSLATRLSLKLKLVLLVGMFVAGLLGFGFASASMLSFAKVNGPLYHRIIQNKDLLADALPPPVFALEPYLVAYQICDTQDTDSLESLVERQRKLKHEYKTRLEYWSQTLAKGQIRDELVERSNSHAVAMFQLIDHELIPAMRRNQPDIAKTILTTSVRDQFNLHRESIDNLAEMTTEAATQTEIDVANTIT